jgi:enolase
VPGRDELRSRRSNGPPRGLPPRRPADAGARPLRGVADEGGWWPDFATNEEALGALVEAIERAGFAPGAQVAIALDVAASEFGRAGRYTLGLESRELDPTA